MQCKDVPDLPILNFLLAHDGQDCFLFHLETSERSVLFAMPVNTPWKVAKAKMARLIQRGLVDGCDCGCRGDFTLTEKGRKYLDDRKAEPR